MGRSPPNCEPEPPLFAAAQDDAGCHGASSGDAPAQRPPSCALCFGCQKGVHVRSVPALSPLWGRVWRVLGRTSSCLDGCFREFWPETVDPSRAALTFPQPKRYPACRKCIFKQVSSGRLKVGVGPWAVSGAAASCQTMKERADEPETNACCSVGGHHLSPNHIACNSCFRQQRECMGWQ